MTGSPMYEWTPLENGSDDEFPRCLSCKHINYSQKTLEKVGFFWEFPEKAKENQAPCNLPSCSSLRSCFWGLGVGFLLLQRSQRDFGNMGLTQQIQQRNADLWCYVFNGQVRHAWYVHIWNNPSLQLRAVERDFSFAWLILAGLCHKNK